MNEITYLEYADFKFYNPIFVFNEDLLYDNCFCILNTDLGNIAFSYHNTGIKPGAVIHDNLLFLGFGVSFYVIDLNDKKIIYKNSDRMFVFFEVIKCSLKECILIIEELGLKCFSFKGKLMWENHYPYIIYDWLVSDNQIIVIYENGEKKMVSYKNGSLKDIDEIMS